MATQGTFGGRRGWTIAQRLRAPDSYGLLSILVIASIIVTVWSDTTVGNVLTVLFQGVALLFALVTSRARAATIRAAIALVLLSVIGAAVGSAVASSTGLVISSGVRAALTIAALVAIAHRLGTHPVVSGETLLGAICVYLLIGLLFAAVDGMVEGIQGTAFFVQVARTTWMDRLYFSYVTLATVGFGDLTPATDAGRVSAITEALTGQLYLVSVVAVVVGNLGRLRNRDDRS
jgi:Ion channel